MVRKSTYTKVIDFLNNIVKSNSTFIEYCKSNSNKNCYNIWRNKINKILNDIPTDAHILELQDKIINLCNKVNYSNTEPNSLDNVVLGV